MTLKGLAKALVLKLIEETADRTPQWHAKVLVLKLIEEASRHVPERASKGARPQTN